MLRHGVLVSTLVVDGHRVDSRGRTWPWPQRRKVKQVKGFSVFNYLEIRWEKLEFNNNNNNNAVF